MVVGCSKKQTLEVTGIVKDGNTDVPIDGVLIHFEQSKLSYGTYSNAFSLLGSKQSNEVGFFNAEFDTESVVQYRIRASKNGYFASNDTLSRNEWRANQENFRVINLYQKSALRIHAFNHNYPGLRLILKLMPNSPRCRECCGKQTFIFDGLMDTLIVCPAYGGSSIQYETLRVSGSGGQRNEGSIEMNADTVRFDLEIR